MRQLALWLMATAVIAGARALPAQRAELPEHTPPGPKSPGTATLLSDLGIAVPVFTGVGMALFKPASADAGPGRTSGYERAIPILIGAGLLIGPSVGQFYAHRTGWLLTRTLVGGTLVAVGTQINTDLRSAFYGAGFLLIGITMVEDLGTAGDAARLYNYRHANARVTLRPLPDPHGARWGVGLSINH